LIFVIILALFSVYFLTYEALQLQRSGYRYFTDPWNWIDTLPLLFLILVGFRSTKKMFHSVPFGDSKGEEDVFVALAASTSILLQFKLLYFFRSSGSVGWLIRLVIEVVYDMRAFMVIFILTIFAFSDAFYTLIKANGYEDALEVYNFPGAIYYTFMLTLGEFTLDGVDPVFKCFFSLCAVFNLIIMLNLLIAILSETHAKVTEVSDLMLSQEISTLISDFIYFDKSTPIEKRKLVLMVFEKEQTDNIMEHTDLAEISDEISKLKKEVAIVSKTLVQTNTII